MTKSQDTRVVALKGNYHYRREVLAKIRQSFDKQFEPGGYDVSIYSNEETFEFVYGRVIASSCFASQRLIILNDWPKPKTTKPTMMKHLKKMLEKTPPDCMVVLNEPANISDKMIQFVKDLPYGRVCVDRTFIERYNASRWIEGELEKRGKNIESSDADLLIESIETPEGQKLISIDQLLLLADKLCSYMGGRKGIKHNDVMAICVGSNHFTVWGVLNSLDAKDYCGAIAVLNQTIESEKKPIEAINRLLYLMIWKFKLLLFLKECQAQGWDEGRIKYAASQLCKMKRSGSFYKTQMSIDLLNNGEPRRAYTSYMIDTNLQGSYGNKASVNCYTRKELYLIAKALQEAMLQVRSGCTTTEAILAIDSIFMMVCGILEEEEAAKLRRTSYV